MSFSLACCGTREKDTKPFLFHQLPDLVSVMFSWDCEGQRATRNTIPRTSLLVSLLVLLLVSLFGSLLVSLAS